MNYRYLKAIPQNILLSKIICVSNWCMNKLQKNLHVSYWGGTLYHLYKGMT